ncbi:UNVERIFIED_CONTAM: hypothetical protein FKN15_077241 [Acipenser sinensis]
MEVVISFYGAVFFSNDTVIWFQYMVKWIPQHTKDIGQSSETLRYKAWFKVQLDVPTRQRSKAHIKIYFRVVNEE